MQHSSPSFTHSYSRGVLMHNVAAVLNHQISASIRMGRKQLPAIDKSDTHTLIRGRFAYPSPYGVTRKVNKPKT